MKTLEIIYWLRLALGITAALICIGYGLATGTISNTKFTFNTFMNGISMALVTYLMSYYIIKFKFMHKVEKPQKLLTTGIGIYFISWLVFWVLLYTIIAAA
ncbi:MAG: hypothetical protein QMD13_04055 [Candidatus Bathyarchaeia archaeon]|nr:hypothetical protein [Candidatus Bathyarchaeia archaeon]